MEDRSIGFLGCREGRFAFADVTDLQIGMYKMLKSIAEEDGVLDNRLSMQVGLLPRVDGGEHDLGLFQKEFRITPFGTVYYDHHVLAREFGGDVIVYYKFRADPRTPEVAA